MEHTFGRGRVRGPTNLIGSKIQQGNRKKGFSLPRNGKCTFSVASISIAPSRWCRAASARWTAVMPAVVGPPPTGRSGAPSTPSHRLAVPAAAPSPAASFRPLFANTHTRTRCLHVRTTGDRWGGEGAARHGYGEKARKRKESREKEIRFPLTSWIAFLRPALRQPLYCFFVWR